MLDALAPLRTTLLSAAPTAPKEVKNVVHTSAATASNAFLDGILSILQVHRLQVGATGKQFAKCIWN